MNLSLLNRCLEAQIGHCEIIMFVYPTQFSLADVRYILKNTFKKGLRAVLSQRCKKRQIWQWDQHQCYQYQCYQHQGISTSAVISEPVQYTPALWY